MKIIIFLFYPNKINIIIDIDSVFADNSIHAHFSHCEFSSRSCTIIYVKKIHLERTITHDCKANKNNKKVFWKTF